MRGLRRNHRETVARKPFTTIDADLTASFPIGHQ
jgi:hypothetical protein